MSRQHRSSLCCVLSGPTPIRLRLSTYGKNTGCCGVGDGGIVAIELEDSLEPRQPRQWFHGRQEATMRIPLGVHRRLQRPVDQLPQFQSDQVREALRDEVGGFPKSRVADHGTLQLSLLELLSGQPRR